MLYTCYLTSPNLNVLTCKMRIIIPSSRVHVQLIKFQTYMKCISRYLVHSICAISSGYWGEGDVLIFISCIDKWLVVPTSAVLVPCRYLKFHNIKTKTSKGCLKVRQYSLFRIQIKCLIPFTIVVPKLWFLRLSTAAGPRFQGALLPLLDIDYPMWLQQSQDSHQRTMWSLFH